MRTRMLSLVSTRMLTSIKRVSSVLVKWTASSCGRRSAFLVLAQAVQGVVEHTAFEINISTLIQYITQSSYATFDPGFK